MASKEYTEVYRDHTVQFSVSKLDDNDFWSANGRVEFSEGSNIRSVNLKATVKRSQRKKMRGVTF